MAQTVRAAEVAGRQGRPRHRCGGEGGAGAGGGLWPVRSVPAGMPSPREGKSLTQAARCSRPWEPGREPERETESGPPPVRTQTPWEGRGRPRAGRR